MTVSSLRWLSSAACLATFAFPVPAQTPPGTLTTIWNFSLDSSSGESREPETGVIVDPNGVLYGTTWGNANIFSLTPSKTGGPWIFIQLYAFPTIWFGQAGYSAAPNGLAIDSHGVLYDTNASGGNLTGPCGITLVGCGSVYLLRPTSQPGGGWIEKTLYTFTGGDDGASPAAGVTIGPGGVLYGTAELKGAAGLGTAFSLTPPGAPGGEWVEATLHTFGEGIDGGAPAGALAIDASGILYGTTKYGGTANCGTVFSLTPPANAGELWTESVLYSFTGEADGSLPDGGVVLGPGGVLYGSTSFGGAYNGGTVYSLTPPAVSFGAWSEAVLHSFPLGSFPSGPCPGPLTFGPNGALYGTAYVGGGNREGSVFALTPPATAGAPWGYVEVYSLDQTTGYNPAITAILGVGPGGLIFGTSMRGGTSNEGTVFELRP